MCLSFLIITWKQHWRCKWYTSPTLLQEELVPLYPSKLTVNHALHKLSAQGESSFLVHPQISTSQFFFAKEKPFLCLPPGMPAFLLLPPPPLSKPWAPSQLSSHGSSYRESTVSSMAAHHIYLPQILSLYLHLP